MSLTPRQAGAHALSEDLFFVRGLSILLVILVHVLGVEPFQGLRGLFSPDRGDLRTLAEVIHSFNMAVMLIGSGVAVSLFGRSGMGLWGFLTKKVDKLLIPMLAWAPVFLLTHHLSKARPQGASAWLALLREAPTAWFPPFSIFWFVHALLFCTFSWWLLQRLVAGRLGRWEGAAYLGVAVVVHALVGGWSARVGGVVPEYVAQLLYWSRFFGLGLVVYPWLQPLRERLLGLPRLAQVLPVPVLLGLLLLNYSAWAGSDYHAARVLNGPLAFALELCLAVCGRDLLKRWGGRWGKLQAQVCAAGSLSMIIYLFHIYFLTGVRLVLARLVPGAALAVHVVLGCVAGLAGPLLLYRALEGNRLFRWSVGLGRTAPPRIAPTVLEAGTTRG